MTRRLLTLTVGLSLLVGLGAACSGTDSGPDGVSADDGQPRTAGLQLTSDNLGNTDVSGMHFVVRNCGGGVVDRATKDFEDMYLPGGISALERKPYDEDSKHIFADHYFLLAAGCYDVIAQPLRSLSPRRNSNDCDAARKNNVQVEDGETTEILLISQCKGPEKGGLDVIGSVNHPPEIKDVTFKPSKFLTSCHRDQKDVCVTVHDPDGDPLETVWRSTRGGDKIGSIAQTYRRQIDGTTWKFCAKMATGPKGKYGWRFRVFDQAYNAQGQLVRIQRLLQRNLHGKCQADKTNCTSNDHINAWFYAGKACQARSAAILMAMNNRPGPRNQGYSKPFIRQTADWVNPVVRKGGVEPSVLYILDDNHQGEHGVNGLFDGPDGDAKWVIDALEAEFGAANVDAMDEPAGGVQLSKLRQYDIVWFANPGHELDDTRTRNRLRTYRNTGGALVLQGDDMAGGNGSGPSMRSLTFLNRRSNGTTTCGVHTDNNVGANYRMRFTQEPITALNGAIMDLRGDQFRYGNDIDHTVRRAAGERILLNARFQNRNCPNGVRYPAAVAIDPIDL